MAGGAGKWAAGAQAREAAMEGGGRLKIILSGWGARARSRLVWCQRTPGEMALGRAERDSHSSAGRGARLRSAAARVLRLPPKPPAPSEGGPSPGPGAAGSGPRLQPCAAGGKHVIIYYLRALIGLRH